MKVAIIGGGSYLWSFGFSRQFILSKHLRDVHLTLMDIDASALVLISCAAQRFNTDTSHTSRFRAEFPISRMLFDSYTANVA